jgi:PAS domain S-box-containing protein
MTISEDHTNILESVIDTLDEGIAVLDEQLRVLFWNAAATAITGYQPADMLARECPSNLYQFDSQATHISSFYDSASCDSLNQSERPVQVHLLHQLGHTLPAMLRRSRLSNEFGGRSGTVLRFHPVEEIDALPHGKPSEDASLERSQSNLADRLDAAWQEWHTNTVPFGVLWLTVDQAATLRKSHGRDASEAMLNVMETSLLHVLKPTETLGRWGENEFLIISHERSSEMLSLHAERLASVARSADFHWWGDRIPLTVSIGAAQAERQDASTASGSQTLTALLRGAQQAMQALIDAGGNAVTHARRQACSQS